MQNSMKLLLAAIALTMFSYLLAPRSSTTTISTTSKSIEKRNHQDIHIDPETPPSPKFKFDGQAPLSTADFESDQPQFDKSNPPSNFFDCASSSKLGNGNSHHPVIRRFPCFKGRVKAGYVASGWLGQITPVHVHCWGERKLDQKKKLALPTYGACGFSREVMKNVQPDGSVRFSRQTDLAVLEATDVETSLPTVADNEYYEQVALLAAVSRARGSFVMIELGAGWGRWLMHAFHANKHSKKNLPITLIGVEADPLHFQFMKQNFVANGVDPDEHILLFGGVSTISGEDRITRMNPAASYGAALVDDRRFGFTTVPTTSLADIISNFWIVDHIDFDIQGMELPVISGSRTELERAVRSIWIECHTAEVYFAIVDIFREWGWTFVFNLPPKELGRTVDFGQGPVELETAHGGVAVLNPYIE